MKPKTKGYLREVVSGNGKHLVFYLTAAMLREMTEGLSSPIGHPMLLTCGEHDLKFIRNLSTKWHKHQANSTRYSVIKDAHHIANQDNPEGFHEILSPFAEEMYA